MVAALLRFPESGCGSGRHSGPLAREIPDIFRHGWRRAGKFRNDDRGVWPFVLRVVAGAGMRSGASRDAFPSGGTTQKNNIVIPEFSAWLTLVLEQCRAENIRNLPRQRAPTPLFPERRPREACSMPISGCHDLPLATFNLPSRVFRHGCRRANFPNPKSPPAPYSSSSSPAHRSVGSSVFRRGIPCFIIKSDTAPKSLMHPPGRYSPLGPSRNFVSSSRMVRTKQRKLGERFPPKPSPVSSAHLRPRMSPMSRAAFFLGN